MYFKRLEMQGFKSFADPVTIELNDGITCIVGPNGSGKSNISDALRWVIGEQSPKSLRGGKMDDVIFAGTATRKPKGMAEVTLVIDNTTNLLPLEYNEVAITRRMYRSGESEYLINGNQCRLRDIKELFMDTGIGVDGYSIIGQGKIQDIVGTKPENRREIFEEAAGIVLYKSRKADAERKLKAASDNLERVRDIIGEIEGRIGGLKEDSEKATEYLQLRERYQYVGVNIILHNITSLEKTLEASEQELKDLEKQYEAKVKENEDLEALIEQKRLTEAELDEKHEESNQQLLAKIEELNMITNRGQVNTERLQGIERELTRLASVIEETATKLTSERNNFEELEKNEKAYDEERAKAEEDLNQAIHQLNERNTKYRALTDEIEKSKSDIIELNNKMVNKRADITTLENYRVNLNDRREQLQSDFDGRDETDAENRRKLEEIAAAFTAKNEEAESAASRLNEIVNNIESVNKNVIQIQRSMEDTMSKLNRATARKNTIEEMENNYEGYNNAVRALMQHQARGIIGTVGDLITVPSGYELAIETALGGALQNIVCEDDGSAKSAVRWLKEKSAGRATFLPVSSIRAYSPEPDQGTQNAQGYLGVASDMVETDHKYREILDYLLGRVILVDNMDHAVSMSKRSGKGFRLVTLDGEVINASGAITGGRYRNKTANLLERKKEIEDLQEKINGYQREMEALKNKRLQCEEQVRQLKDERSDLYGTLQQLEVDRGVLKSDRDHAQSLVEAAGSDAERYSAEIKTIGSDIDNAGEMIAKHKKEIDESAEEIRKLEEKVEMMMQEAEKYQSIIEEDNEAIVQKRLYVSEQETKILGLNELIERVRDSVGDLEALLEHSQGQHDDLAQQKELLTSSGERSDEKKETLAKEKEELEAFLKELAEKIDQNKAEYEQALQQQKQCSKNTAALQDAKYKMEVKTARNETLLTTQKDKLWDDFEISYAEAVDMRDEDFAITAGNKEAREIRLRMSELGDVNVSAIEEYKAVSKRYEFMTAQESDLTKAMDELREIINNMDATIKQKFKETFDEVVVNFEAIFAELFGGGHAELRLEDENDPLLSGIEIIAQPPGKKLKNINLMSGGEKTMTAIALMFAVLKAKPTPFCILDEVEAALDEANIERFSAYLKKFEEVQFALITHHKATMEHADVLYGVTMPEQGITRVLSLKFEDGFDPDEFTA